MFAFAADRVEISAPIGMRMPPQSPIRCLAAVPTLASS
jgi:hypothetical protein